MSPTTTRTALLCALFCVGLLLGCAPGKSSSGEEGSAEVSVTDLERAPEPTAADEPLARVFGPLDGTWRGTFEVWVDTSGQSDAPAQPVAFDLEAITARPEVELQSTLEVEQVYRSESPYFQRVTITDSYPDGRVVESSGVNKVQDGELWCVVDKPDDLVVHRGEFREPHTIIWSRQRREPKAYEYFREVVEAERYTIEGWGYYGEDDVERSPRMWFRAAYVRQ